VPPNEGCRLPSRIGAHPVASWPAPTSMTCSLCSTGITPFHHYYGAVRPWPAHRYFRPRGFGRLRLFPWHRRPGSQVPYESPNESHASYTPDTTWPVGRFPPRSSWNKGTAPVSMSHRGFDALSEVCLRSSLSFIPDVINVPPFDHDVHHRGFCPQQLMAVWSLPLQGGSEGSSFISRTA
jgi:hypothetical protein